jgi:hypothetical protein
LIPLIFHLDLEDREESQQQLLYICRKLNLCNLYVEVMVDYNKFEWVKDLILMCKTNGIRQVHLKVYWKEPHHVRSFVKSLRKLEEYSERNGVEILGKWQKPIRHLKWEDIQPSSYLSAYQRRKRTEEEIPGMVSHKQTVCEGCSLEGFCYIALENQDWCEVVKEYTDLVLNNI